MADNNTSKVVLEIDVEQAKKDLERLAETIKELNATTDDTGDVVKDLEKQWDKLDEAIKSAEANTENATIGMKEMGDASNVAARAVTSFGLSNTTAGKAIIMLNNIIGTAKRALASYESTMKTANTSTKALTASSRALSVALKSIIVVAVVGGIVKIAQSLQEAAKSSEKLTAQMKNLQRLQSRIQGIGGLDEVTQLQLQRKVLELEEQGLWKTFRLNGKFTEEELKRLKEIEDQTKEINIQLRYTETMKRAQVQTEKNILEISKEQQKISSDIATNETKAAKLQTKLSYYEQKAKYSKEYFDTQKAIDDLEQENFSLREKDFDLQIKAISRQEELLDLELEEYTEAVRKRDQLTKNEQDQAILRKNREISLQKETLELQKQGILSEKQVNNLNKQANATDKMVRDYTLMKQMNETANKLLLQYGQTAAKNAAKSVTDYDNLREVWNLSNNALKDLSYTYNDLSKQILELSKNDNIGSFKNLQDGLDALRKRILEFKDTMGDGSGVDPSTLTRYQQQFVKFTNLYEQFSTKLEEISTYVEENIAVQTEAQVNRLTSLTDVFSYVAPTIGQQAFLLFTDVERSAETGILSINALKDAYKTFPDDMDAAMKEYARLRKSAGLGENDYGLSSLMRPLFENPKEMMPLIDNWAAELAKAAQESFATYFGSVSEYFSQQVSVTDVMTSAGTAVWRSYWEARENELKYNLDYEIAQETTKAQELLRIAGENAEERAKIEEALAKRVRDIEMKNEAEIMVLRQEKMNAYASQYAGMVSNLTTILDSSFEENKQMQIASVALETTANAALAGMSTFAQTKGGVAVKAAAAALATAAVLAQGLRAIGNLKSMNKNTDSPKAADVPNTGTSAVAKAIVSRDIRSVEAATTTNTVLVVDEVTAKQMEQERINKVSTI